MSACTTATASAEATRVPGGSGAAAQAQRGSASGPTDRSSALIIPAHNAPALNGGWRILRNPWRVIGPVNAVPADPLPPLLPVPAPPDGRCLLTDSARSPLAPMLPKLELWGTLTDE